MPSYDLTCRACGDEFEKFLTRLLRTGDLVCPSCGSTDVRRGVGGGYSAPRVGSTSVPGQGTACGSARFG